MDPHASSDHLHFGPDHVTPVSAYLAIFGGLMVLTIVTVAVAWLDLGFLNIAVALAVAVIKATLVVLYFMHLKYSSRLTWIVAAAGFFWLLILLGLTMADYGTRGWMTGPHLVP